MADLNNFHINTDYPQDIICFFYEGMPDWELSGYMAQAYIENPFEFNPLLFGSWCETSNFISPKQLNTTSVTHPVTWMPLQDTCVVASMEAGGQRNIRLTMTAASGTAQPVYVRLYGLIPTDISPEVLSTSTNAYKLIFNSDFTYRKLLIAGVQDITATTPVIIDHNLGYHPQIMAWSENIDTQYSTKFIDPIAASRLLSNNQLEHQVLLTPTRLSFIFKDIVTSSTTSWRVHYRIYADEA